MNLKPQTPPTPGMPAIQPAAPPTLGATPQGQKPTQKSTQPTFLGGGLFSNPSNTGQKTLLGQ